MNSLTESLIEIKSCSHPIPNPCGSALYDPLRGWGRVWKLYYHFFPERFEQNTANAWKRVRKQAENAFPHVVCLIDRYVVQAREGSIDEQLRNRLVLWASALPPGFSQELDRKFKRIVPLLAFEEQEVAGIPWKGFFSADEAMQKAFFVRIAQQKIALGTLHRIVKSIASVLYGKDLIMERSLQERELVSEWETIAWKSGCKQFEAEDPSVAEWHKTHSYSGAGVCVQGLNKVITRIWMNVLPEHNRWGLELPQVKEWEEKGRWVSFPDLFPIEQLEQHPCKQRALLGLTLLLRLFLQQGLSPCELSIALDREGQLVLMKPMQPELLNVPYLVKWLLQLCKENECLYNELIAQTGIKDHPHYLWMVKAAREINGGKAFEQLEISFWDGISDERVKEQMRRFFDESFHNLRSNRNL